MKSFEFSKGLNIKAKPYEGEVVSGEEISNEYHGDAADVTRLDYRFGKHQRTFVLKDYEQSPWPEPRERDSKSEVLKSIEMWKAVRDAGLPTFTTYRAEKDGTSILMNDLRTEKTSALSVTHSPQEWYDGEREDKNRIKKISNFPQLIDDLNKCSHLAASHDFSLEPDAYFFLVTVVEDGEYEIHPFVGDFEGMSFFNQNANFNVEEQSKEEYNKVYAKSTLKSFIETFMQPEYAKEYVEQLEASAAFR